jgi:peptidoglycan/xylan/chitin deacetylase (PgdA/CDA1 family)
MLVSTLIGGVLAAAAAHGAFHRNSVLFGRALGRLPTRDRVIALTFDDGPNADATPRVLDTLGEAHVPATFFLLGRHVEHHPGLALRIADQGHALGNHGFHHRKLHDRGPRYVRRDLQMGTDAIANATGRRPVFFRAPHGFRSPWVTPIARSLGQRTVGWTLGVWDSDRPGASEIARRAIEGCTPGAILLLHDGDGSNPTGDRRQTADALPRIIRGLRERGFEFVRLPA